MSAVLVDYEHSVVGWSQYIPSLDLQRRDCRNLVDWLRRFLKAHAVEYRCHFVGIA